jgi:tryptophan synthase alpha chain
MSQSPSQPNRITATFAALRAANRAGFIAYITAGDPTPARTPEIIRTLESAGVDILELGVPFSDPLADGATIQAAAGRAIAAGTSVAGVLEIIREVRRTSQIPIVLFTYLNPIYVYGFEKFCADAAQAGADGILVLDLPPDEAARHAEFASFHGLFSIRLIAPTTPPERVGLIARSAEGFIYYVSREGVTGEQSTLSLSIAGQVAEIRRHTPLPIAVGFGISTPEQARAVAAHAEAVVVGSAVVNQIAEHGKNKDLVPKVSQFVHGMVQAVKQTT